MSTHYSGHRYKNIIIYKYLTFLYKKHIFIATISGA